MKVLVPVDGSKHAEEALRAAVDLLKTKGGELLVVTVVPSFEALDLELSAAGRDSLRKNLEERGDRVLKTACDAARASGLPTTCKVEVSGASVADTIVEIAEREAAGLVVIGSRGLSPSSRWRMGSVASRVVRHAPCSVWVVKLPARG